MTSRIRKLLLPIGVAVLLLGGAVATVPSLLWGDHADYSRVVSIKESRDYQAPALMRKAWALPVATLYQESIDFQRNVSFCGPASIVNILHSLHQPGDQATVLEGTGISTVMGILPGGVTLDELAEVARKRLRGKVSVLRDLDRNEFREHLRQTNNPSRRYVVNFTRGPLFATGGGHHSPIAGYLVDEDLVLILDVNRDYGPWLAKSERLYEAMNTLDTGAGKKRGMLLIE
jgi:phytochelatin synthase